MVTRQEKWKSRLLTIFIMKTTIPMLLLFFVSCFYKSPSTPMLLDDYLASIASPKIKIDTIITLSDYSKSNERFAIFNVPSLGFDFSVKQLNPNGYRCDTCYYDDYPVEVKFNDTLFLIDSDRYINQLITFSFEENNFVLLSLPILFAMGTGANQQVYYLFSKDAGKTKIDSVGESLFNTPHNVGDFDGDGMLEFATISRINPWSDSLVIGFANIQREDTNEINCILGSQPGTSRLFKELKKSPCKDFLDD